MTSNMGVPNAGTPSFFGFLVTEAHSFDMFEICNSRFYGNPEHGPKRRSLIYSKNAIFLSFAFSSKNPLNRWL